MVATAAYPDVLWWISPRSIIALKCRRSSAVAMVHVLQAMSSIGVVSSPSCFTELVTTASVADIAHVCNVCQRWQRTGAYRVTSVACYQGEPPVKFAVALLQVRVAVFRCLVSRVC